MGFTIFNENIIEDKLSKTNNNKNGKKNGKKLKIFDLINLSFKSKYMYILGIIQLLLYINDKMFLNWGPILFSENNAMEGSILDGSAQVVIYDIASIIGIIIMGCLSDKVFINKRTIPCIICALGVAIFCIVFVIGSKDSTIINIICVFCLGIFVNPPIFLVSAFCSELGDKKGIATAIGFLGTMGYIGTAISGAGTAMIVEKFSWDAVILSTMIIYLIIAGLFWLLLYIANTRRN